MIKQNLNGQNGIVQPLLTDLYQITMAYAYWKSEKRYDRAVFDLFFRANPFQGEFTVFAGLEEVLKFLENFQYSDSDIEYLKTTLPSTVDPKFYVFLKGVKASSVTVYAIDEGSIVFPRVPLLVVEGPLIIVQLLETTLLTLINYASLMATNAARYRMAAGKNISLLEFGLRRAQGPDGGLSASKYAYIGGFDGTSNVLAGKLFNIPVRGTLAHSYITSFTGVKDLNNKTLKSRSTGEERDLLELSKAWRKEICSLMGIMNEEASDGELAAFISFAIAFPDGFMTLVDTYDVKRSGLLNFCAVALGLNDLGYQAVGIRIDSGDLAYLSNKAREMFELLSQKYCVPWFAKLVIVASNDINEETILSLNEQNHKINCFGIGTHLVTCQRQPALGCVYKMVEINGIPRIKLSQDVAKITMPGKKTAYRLFGSDGHALIDLMQKAGEEPPKVGKKVLCRHPFLESKRAYVIPAKVEPLYKVWWRGGYVDQELPNLEEVRQKVQTGLETLRNDHKRNLNPTPYKQSAFKSQQFINRALSNTNQSNSDFTNSKSNFLLGRVAVSDELYSFIHELWLQNAPIGELS